ncbi:hypothetical protein BELL_0130g00070 [Botrytis elliptica]|uniref:Uncharacterized protein n=1 Tax=Botrytis elliptica TaxID=278938 RepID=A0A4Z1K6H7_9HELO|nr:hypothetical protein EAE99_009718 [Botrytis elliptica]TGO76937.1 hypothetical protein BELL_0130g00070 [Botrytis elliptica]
MTTLTLSAKETEMLVAVMSEMGEIPSNINFDRVAARVKVKFAKNARQSFKKLFEKLKDQAGPSPDDEDGATPPKTPSPTKKTSPKKKVGPKNAPIKAAPKSRGKKGTVKKEVKEEEVDSGDELAEPVLDDEDGKSPENIPSLKAKSLGKNSVVCSSTGSSESLQISDEVAKMSVVEAEETFSTSIEESPVDEQVDLDEQLLAAQSNMSVGAYRHWKALNDYTFLQNS